MAPLITLNWRRVIKMDLTDADGRRLNPVTSFVRFGFAPHGQETYVASFRFLLVFVLGILMLLDAGALDEISQGNKRQSMDGDNVWFFFRPQDLIHGGEALLLLLLYVISGEKRVESEVDTQYPKTYLLIWNLILLLLPLSATSFIFYFHVLRWNHYNDKAFEATLYIVFIYNCFELMWGGWPSEPIDVVMPTMASGVFILYTFVFSRLDMMLYKQLDWAGEPQTAAYNAAMFVFITLLVSIVTTAIAMGRNNCLRKRGCKKKYATVSDSVDDSDMGA